MLDEFWEIFFQVERTAGFNVSTRFEQYKRWMIAAF